MGQDRAATISTEQGSISTGDHNPELEATTTSPGMAGGESDQASKNKVTDLRHLKDLYPGESDMSAYFYRLAEYDAGSDIASKTKPNQRAATFAQRFAEAYFPRLSRFKSEEIAVHETLERLTLSVLVSDPSVSSRFVTSSRLDAINVEGPDLVGSVLDALNALSVVAPSLLSCESNSRPVSNALDLEWLEYIARMRPRCWKTKLYLVGGKETGKGKEKEKEKLYAKTEVDYAFVEELWQETLTKTEVRVDEIVFRILCAIPLRGNPQNAEDDD